VPSASATAWPTFGTASRSWRESRASAAWRDGDDAAATGGPSLDWVFAEYRADRRYAKLDVRTKRAITKAASA